MYFHNETHGVMRIKHSAMTRSSCQNMVSFAVFFFFLKREVFSYPDLIKRDVTTIVSRLFKF